MKAKLRALSAQYDMLPAGARVLCAVSGGADSMTLLHMLHAMEEEESFTLAAAHFNHRLRGEESLRDEQFVRARCEEWGIPLLCGGADVAAEAASTGCGVEETARRLRYEFLAQAADRWGAGRIATAHTANDNAETVLFHLVRGSGLPGLTGIPPRRDNIVRPLLTCTRAEVETYCARNGVPYVEDSTNRDPSFTRNYLRGTVMPLLEQVNPRAVEHLSATAQGLREDQSCLEEQALLLAGQSKETKDGWVISVQTIRDAHPAIAGRVIRVLMERAGIQTNGSRNHVRLIIDLCRSTHPSGQIALPGVRVHRRYGELVFSPKTKERDVLPQVEVPRNGCVTYGATGWSVSCRESICPAEPGKNPAHFYLSCAKMRGTLSLRPRETGDRITLPGRPGKTLKKLLIDEKVPCLDRGCLPVLADEAGVAALISFGPDVARLAQPGEAALEITVQKRD